MLQHELKYDFIINIVFDIIAICVVIFMIFNVQHILIK
jgi:hypothetical protein